MASRWLLTVASDCDRVALGRALEAIGVRVDPKARPLPLDGGEMAISVTTADDALPAQVERLAGVLRVHPASKMKLIR